MRDISAMRAGAPAEMGFVEKALQLLTRDWSLATWRSRADILRTVDWLLRMERARRRAAPVLRAPR